MYSITARISPTPKLPTIGSVISAASPVLVEMSSTHHPDPTSAAASTAGTKRRDRWPTQWSPTGCHVRGPGPKFVRITGPTRLTVPYRRQKAVVHQRTCDPEPEYQNARREQSG